MLPKSSTFSILWLPDPWFPRGRQLPEACWGGPLFDAHFALQVVPFYTLTTRRGQHGASAWDVASRCGLRIAGASPPTESREGYAHLGRPANGMVGSGPAPRQAIRLRSTTWSWATTNGWTASRR